MTTTVETYADFQPRVQLQYFRMPVEVYPANSDTPIQIRNPFSVDPTVPVSAAKQALLDMMNCPVVTLDDSTTYEDDSDPEILLSDSDEEDEYVIIAEDDEADANTAICSDDDCDQDSVLDCLEFDEHMNESFEDSSDAFAANNKIASIFH
jgi:hypothetical protein